MPDALSAKWPAGLQGMEQRIRTELRMICQGRFPGGTSHETPGSDGLRHRTCQPLVPPGYTMIRVGRSVVPTQRTVSIGARAQSSNRAVRSNAQTTAKISWVGKE